MFALQNNDIDYIYRDNVPIAVILEINIFNEILERIEDFNDIEYLRKIRENPIEYRSFDSFLADNNKNV